MQCHRRCSSITAAALFALLAACPAHAADTIQFTHRPPQVGQRGSQELQVQLDLKVTLQQKIQVISTDQQQLTRNQQREVTVLNVAKDRATQVRVYYSQAREVVTRGKQSALPQAQPIEGKAYLVQRAGEELIVTDVQNQQVPEVERALVVASMDSIGRPSPLGTYLHGKKVAVGETLRLPNELASSLLGVREAGGEAQAVELKLRAVRAEPDRRVADFAMLVVLKLPGGGTLNVEGDVQLEPDTCRVVAANFTGPVKLQEEHGPKGHTFEVLSEGTMKVAVRSRYGK